MSFFTRGILALSACLLLCQCQLINTALRLWPLLMLVDNEKAPASRQGLMDRGSAVEGKGVHLRPRAAVKSDSALVLHR